jgi:RNA polymerase sigma-70 factor (ECF subfamily)
MTHLDDRDVVARVRAGQRDEVIAELLPEYRTRVFHLAYGILRDSAAAEDAAQDVFVNVWRALPQYDGRAKLSTWIYAIARNTSISALRRRRAEVSMSDDAIALEAESALLSRAEPDAGGDTITADRLAAHLARLSERQRQVVTLYYLEERPVEEVADMLAMPVGTVKNYLFRARAALQRSLGSESGVHR